MVAVERPNPQSDLKFPYLIVPKRFTGAAKRTQVRGCLPPNQPYFFASGLRLVQSSGGKLMRQKPGLGLLNSSAVLNFLASAGVTSLTVQSVFSLVRTFSKVTGWPCSSGMFISTSAP